MKFTNKKKYIDLKPYADNIDEELDKIQPDDFKGTVEFTDGVNLEFLVTKINQRLTALLGRDHTIGHAWLMNVFCLEDLQAAFNNRILPLLKEFFYNDYAKIGLVLGENFVKANPIGQNMFAEFKQGNELASEYADKTNYTIEDPFNLRVDQFKSIYQ
jgi:5-methylcytosine-specific restriction protein B